MIVRPETGDDRAATRRLQLDAFAPSEVEADIADALRAAHAAVSDLCLVATEDDGTIRGHVMLSHATIGQARHPALGLGPIAVDPAHQGRGIGSALMHATIERAGRTAYPLIALLGHPAYYPRFGFRPAEATFGLTTRYDAPPEAWMALALPAYEPHIRGRFSYADAFGA